MAYSISASHPAMRRYAGHRRMAVHPQMIETTPFAMRGLAVGLTFALILWSVIAAVVWRLLA